jgi:hypothetical protein
VEQGQVVWEVNSFVIPLAEAGEFVGDALAGGFGFFLVEFDVLGLAGDDVQGESGALFGFGGEGVCGVGEEDG